jgi:hypothetical protein
VHSQCAMIRQMGLSEDIAAQKVLMLVIIVPITIALLGGIHHLQTHL